MPSREDLQELKRFLSRARTINLLVYANGTDDEDDPPVIQRLNIHDDIAADFLEVADKSVPDREDLVLREYEPGYKPDPHETTYIAADDLPEVDALINDMQSVDASELFDEDDDVIKRLHFYAIVVGGQGGRQATFFRHYSPKKELGRHAAFALMLSRGNYNRVREKVFLFDNAVDAFSWDGTLYIKNAHQFQRIFGYFDAIRDQATETIQELHARAPIHNLDKFEEACTGHMLMMAKLSSIARKPYLANIGINDLKGTIERFDLEVDIVEENGEEQLVFDSTPEKRWTLLKLFDDDFLDSGMTQEKYEVNSKVRR